LCVRICTFLFAERWHNISVNCATTGRVGSGQETWTHVHLCVRSMTSYPDEACSCDDGDEYQHSHERSHHVDVQRHGRQRRRRGLVLSAVRRCRGAYVTAAARSINHRQLAATAAELFRTPLSTRTSHSERSTTRCLFRINYGIPVLPRTASSHVSGHAQFRRT